MGRWVELAHLHGDVALLDGEQLEGSEGGLAGLCEPVYLDRQVVALRVPVQAHICKRTNLSAGCALHATGCKESSHVAASDLHIMHMPVP